MKYVLIFMCAALIQPCNSLGFDQRALSFPWIVGVGVLALVPLASCYVFYPAYKSIEGGLGCTTTVLAGDATGGPSQGECKFQRILCIAYLCEPNFHVVSIVTENTLSLVIPAYNEAERLPIMLDATLGYLDAKRKYVTQLFRAVGGQKKDWSALVQFEYVIVNDGSTDDTENVVRKYASTIQGGDTVKLVSMHKNSGKGGAVKTGMLQSSGQLCLMVDADGATDIGDGLPKLLKEIKCVVADKQSSNDAGFLPPAAVFGSRAHLEEESCASRSKVRTFLMHAFHFFVKTLCSPRIKDTQCGFKLFTRSAAVLLFTNLHLRRWAFDTELVVIAEKLDIVLSEVGVVWHEIDGSKLDVGKLSLALVSLGMLRDMLCVRACYFLGLWKLKR